MWNVVFFQYDHKAQSLPLPCVVSVTTEANVRIDYMISVLINCTLLVLINETYGVYAVAPSSLV